MLIPATLTVNFIANYTGQHRVCWRIQGMPGPFICTNIVDCVGGGNVCSAVINIMVDPDSCDTVIYEGYIQATCNPEGSGTGQIPWVESYVPNPSCAKYAVQCTLGPGQSCGPITSQELGLNCNGTVRPAVDFISGGGTFFLCNTTVLPVLPPDYSIVLDGCCYECNNYEISYGLLPGGDFIGASVYYLDCTTRELIRVDLINLVVNPLNICAVTGSVYVEYDPVKVSIAIADLGVCP